MAGSPIIAGDAVILVCDQMSGSFMVALDRQTGRERWRRARPGITVSWTTPMVFAPGGGADAAADRAQLDAAGRLHPRHR